MDLKKRYREEKGKTPTEIGGSHYTDEYVDWLEEQIQILSEHNPLDLTKQLEQFVNFYNKRNYGDKKICKDEIEIYINNF